jgi:hypothetical protein
VHFSEEFLRMPALVCFDLQINGKNYCPIGLKMAAGMGPVSFKLVILFVTQKMPGAFSVKLFTAVINSVFYQLECLSLFVTSTQT